MMDRVNDTPGATTEGGIELAPGISTAPAGLRMQFARSSGPGGQNVNKVNTKVELWLSLEHLRGMSLAAMARLRALAGGRLTIADEIHVTAEAHRSQESNRADAMEKLRQLLIEASVEPKRRRKTRPTRASRKRRLEGKRRRGELKSDRRSTGDW